MENVVTVIGLYGMSLLLNMKSFPQDGQTVAAQSMAVEPGGKGFNQAVSAARNGSPVNFITAVGDDAFGNRLFDDCSAERIVCEYSVTRKETTTAAAAVLSDARGTSRVIVAHGACDTMHPRDLRDGWKKNCKVLLLQHEISPEITLYAAKACSQSGAFVILNPAPARTVSSELMPLIDLIVPNWGEALEITGLTDTDEPHKVALKLKEMGARNVIITLGERGAYVLLDGEPAFWEAAIPVRAVDTTGAGDTFCGVLASCIAKQMHLMKSIRFATIASGLSVTKRGVMQAIPGYHEIDRFITEQHE